MSVEEWVEHFAKISGLPERSQGKMRLATFTLWHRGVKQALEVARQFAGGGGPPLLTFSGPSGTGKTHLVVGVAWEWIEREAAWVVYYQVEDMLEQMRACYDREVAWFRHGGDSPGLTLDGFLRRLKECHLLVLDDLGVQKHTEWAEAKLDTIVDWRYARDLPLLVATNAKREDLPPRIADRLGDVRKGLVVQITAPSYRQHPVEEGGNHDLRREGKHSAVG